MPAAMRADTRAKTPEELEEERFYSPANMAYLDKAHEDYINGKFITFDSVEELERTARARLARFEEAEKMSADVARCV